MSDAKLEQRAREFRKLFWHRDDWKLVEGDDEWDALMQLFAKAELLRAAEIAKREQRHWANPETEMALLNVEGDIRTLAD